MTWRMRTSISLLFGVVTTLAVAWACAAWIEIAVPGNINSVRISSGRWKTTPFRRQFGHTQISLMRGPIRFDTERSAFVEMTASDDVHRDSQYEQRLLAGWPWRSLQCTREVAAFSMPGRFGYFLQRQGPTPTEGGIELIARGMGAPFSWRALPYHPVWPGIVGNILLYSAAWWLVPFGPFILRRRMRLRRGQCPQCGYDLRGDRARGCPECGLGRETAAAP